MEPVLRVEPLCSGQARDDVASPAPSELTMVLGTCRCIARHNHPGVRGATSGEMPTCRLVDKLIEPSADQPPDLPTTRPTKHPMIPPRPDPTLGH